MHDVDVKLNKLSFWYNKVPSKPKLKNSLLKYIINSNLRYEKFKNEMN